MDIFFIIILTLVVYSVISTVAFLISGENEMILKVFGLGIFGLLLSGIVFVLDNIKNIFKYHVRKRSVFEEKSTGEKYKCRTKDTDNIVRLGGYQLKIRYAGHPEWENIPDFDKEIIKNAKENRYR